MPLTRKTIGQGLLLAAFGIVIYFFIRIMQPFLLPIFLALILATLLVPFYELLARRLNGHRSLAALIVCIGLTATILLPVLLLSITLANEASGAYKLLKDPETIHRIEAWFDPGANPIVQRIRQWLPAALSLEKLELGSRLSARAQQIGVATLGAASTFAVGIVNFLADYFIMIVVLFFLLRDSTYFAEAARGLIPLTDEQENLFVERFRTVTRATVFGSLITALAQGAASSLIFFVLGLANPILWGALTALFSLVPVVGTALVWVPWTIYLFASGSVVRAIIFLVLQVLAVGGMDNILRPMLIEGQIKMHTLVIFFSILGGIAYFGILGMFFGPLVFAILTAFLQFYSSDENI
jgi:predicted PurR-regulated permease PerM